MAGAGAAGAGAAGAGVLAFYAAALALFYTLLWLRGYAAWDSSMLQSPTELVSFVLGVALPSMANLAVVPIVGAVDTFWVGRIQPPQPSDHVLTQLKVGESV